MMIRTVCLSTVQSRQELPAKQRNAPAVDRKSVAFGIKRFKVEHGACKLNSTSFDAIIACYDVDTIDPHFVSCPSNN
jgi:hypothetical protein